jgi:3'-phosphoadenosine 5'-phosphosulfate sulfotransferase (PAPS reductase)/FAD synthetase
VGFSGGRDSICVTHWMMNHVPGCQAFHANTGIGIEATREYVRKTCKDFGWPLVEIRAKEDCGQDYEALVREQGFPGPDHHKKMYDRLKGRAVELLVRNTKRHRLDKVMIASGIRHDESLIRMGYAGREINKIGAQVWVNPIYWWSKHDRDDYIAKHNLPVNPISKELGMSGECGCGAYAQPGELKAWKRIDPEFGERIERLQMEVLANGFTWAWDGRPPAGGHNPDQGSLDPNVIEAPLCGTGCMRSAVVQQELEEVDGQTTD